MPEQLAAALARLIDRISGSPMCLGIALVALVVGLLLAKVLRSRL